ncbi:hypothetical protein Ddc_10786 [Ditylenchus destructor]|nr:hypothetical protein Ddc_10786 [Ditylenchus destructor]
MNDTFNNNDDAISKLSQERSWDRKFIEETVEQSRIDINRNTDMRYRDSVSVYHATKYYNISGQVGTVIGSLSPWVEIILLVNDVKHIVTVDYQKVVTTHPKISFLLAQDLAKGHYMYENSFDFAVSFSSVEHSGLGRYGDPLDPFGDVKEIQKIRCMLKPGGLLFLGLPVGKDTVGNNCHRIYGRLRLPFMFEGFELVSTFGRDPNPLILQDEQLLKIVPGVNHDQYTFVLRKTTVKV